MKRAVIRRGLKEDLDPTAMESAMGMIMGVVTWDPPRVMVVMERTQLLEMPVVKSRHSKIPASTVATLAIGPSIAAHIVQAEEDDHALMYIAIVMEVIMLPVSCCHARSPQTTAET